MKGQKRYSNNKKSTAKQKPERKKSARYTPLKNQVVVNSYSQEWLRKDFDRVYTKEVLAIGSQVQAGAMIEICSNQGTFLGMGIAGTGEIAARRFSKEKRELDLSFFCTQLEKALYRRDIPDNTTAWRWVHAENDDLPGIVVEVWHDEITIVLNDESLLQWLDILLRAMQKIRPFVRAWGHVRLGEGKQKSLGLIFGEDPKERIEVRELGIQYWVTPQASKDTGLFCDMRGLRQRLEGQWKYRRVLNLFCYTGAFSVSAAVHGASEVHSVDLSKPYLQRVKDNFELNGINTEEHVFVESDSFQALDRYRRKKEGFDIVIADPPSFSHSAHGIWSVQKDLKRLVIACLRVLLPGGILIIATNHGKMSPREFSKAIQEAAQKENRRLRLLHNYCPESDFPAALHFPEARYLKCWVMQA